jgi:hypothetical protein
MRDVPRIKAAYDWMLSAHDAGVAAATAAGDAAAVDRLGAAREILERGVFVLLFGQFETLVTEYFEQARDNRAANPDWTARRGWDVPAYGDRRVPFETRLALVLDRREPSHGKALQAYAVRNHCAHGGTRQPVGAIDQLVKDLYTWQALLRR